MACITLAARCLVAVVFAVSAITKLRSGAAFLAFSGWVAALPVLPRTGRRAAAVAVAAAEALVVPLVVLPWTFVAGLAIAAAVLGAFTVAAILLARSPAGAVHCQCFGPSTLPLGLPHAVRNALLCAAAAAGAAQAGPTVRHVPGVALCLGIAAAAALSVIFFDDLIALFSGAALIAAPPDDRKVRT